MRVETILKESCNFQKAAEVIGEHNFLPTLSQTHVLPTADLFKSNDGLSNIVYLCPICNGKQAVLEQNHFSLNKINVDKSFKCRQNHLNLLF